MQDTLKKNEVAVADSFTTQMIHLHQISDQIERGVRLKSIFEYRFRHSIDFSSSRRNHPLWG